jgi:Leucine-rich repeat (LRR) protein
LNYAHSNTSFALKTWVFSLQIVNSLFPPGWFLQSTSSSDDQAFNSLRLLNLDDNCISDWSEVLKLSQLPCLEQLYLNKNKLSRIFQSVNGTESSEKGSDPFPSLSCLLLGANNIGDLASVDALNGFPQLVVLIFCSVIL